MHTAATDPSDGSEGNVWTGLEGCFGQLFRQVATKMPAPDGLSQRIHQEAR